MESGFLMADAAMTGSLICIYSTSARKAEETVLERLCKQPNNSHVTCRSRMIELGQSLPLHSEREPSLAQRANIQSLRLQMKVCFPSPNKNSGMRLTTWRALSSIGSIAVHGEQLMPTSSIIN